MSGEEVHFHYDHQNRTGAEWGEPCGGRGRWSSMSSRPAWCTQQVPRQLALHRKSMSQFKKKKEKQKEEQKEKGKNTSYDSICLRCPK